MRAVITGGAGCIGSELAEALIARGDQVVIYDNFSSGRREHVVHLPCTVVEGDLLDRPAFVRAAAGAEFIWHLAANSDVRFSPGRDFEQNAVATHNVLETARECGIHGVAFTSSSAVYGISEVQPIPETQPPRPISLYGATKLAAEALVAAYAHMFGIEAWIFRLANIVGPKVRRRGRTVISDFISKLRENPARLEILGDGRQAKSYLSSAECIEALLFATRHAHAPCSILNVGGSDSLPVRHIAEMVVEAMGLSAVEFTFTGGEGGWPGDVPRFLLDTGALARLGWRARHNSEESVRSAIGATLERLS
ncbi:MAG TPA: NAD-dependent epimerase/dehydratase family protein [Bryobacteraceae bacterium]|nr:NAD-dependent epimerase/dehydratase family protein [Bryobacteraceae bacterium]